MNKRYKKFNLEEILNRPDNSYEKFHQKTKLRMPSKKKSGPLKWPEEWKKVYFKAYARLDEVQLPKPALLFHISLKDSIVQRTSRRNFKEKRLSKKQLSSLLYYSAGLKKFKPPWQANRFYPSGGARYPLETYLLSLKTELPTGLYHYYLKNHSLEQLEKFSNFSIADYVLHDWFKKASCFIIISAVFKRSTIKYGDRGYRFTLMEAGHLGQNFYLLASALSIKCCAIGGFIEDKVNKLLDVDGINESAIYMLAIG